MNGSITKTVTAACCLLLAAFLRLSAEYKHYWVGNSSIPGAGLGVFARRDLPAGTLWNPEDVHPHSTLVLTL
jgi:hypothetical protein